MLVLYAVLTVALGPVLLTRRLLKRWPWIGLNVTPRTAISYVSRAALVAALPGAVAAGLLDDERTGAGVALFFGCLWAFRQSLVVDLWNVRRLLQAIASGDRRGLVRRADAAITRLLRFRNYLGARFMSAIGGLLIGAGAGPEAEKIIASLPFENYIGLPYWLLLHTLAYHRLKLGMYTQAEGALDRCGADAPSQVFDREHRYFRGLVDAATGKPRRALGRLEEGETPERDIVAAHAYITLEREEQAREALERVRKEKNGEALLTQIAKGHGPAKTLALRVLGRELPSEADGGPYR